MSLSYKYKLTQYCDKAAITDTSNGQLCALFDHNGFHVYGSGSGAFLNFLKAEMDPVDAAQVNLSAVNPLHLRLGFDALDLRFLGHPSTSITAIPGLVAVTATYIPFDVNWNAWSFLNGVDQTATFQITIPETRAVGTTIVPYIRSAPSVNGGLGDTHQWRLKVNVGCENLPWDTTYDEIYNVDTSADIAEVPVFHAFPAITPAATADVVILQGSITRFGTLDGDIRPAWLLDIGFRYHIDKLGF